MCKAPVRLADGTMVGCRNCSQCLGRATDDWTGRCIAESKTAKAPFFIALTYGGGDHERAAVLTYSDVQKYMKRLRRNGFPARYFAVGEYGSAKGRAHWHLIVFWQGEVPEHKASSRSNPVRFMERHWPHGWSTWEPLNRNPEDTAAAVRYCCKYLRKDLGGPERQAKLAMSKKPLLGAAWLHRRAGQYVRQGLAPQDLFYSFPDLLERDGRPRRFMLKPGSASADLFCQSFIDQWAEAHDGQCLPVRTPDGQIYDVRGARGLPPSDLIDAYGDRIARPLLESDKWQKIEEEKRAEAEAAVARQRRFQNTHQWGTNYHWDATQAPSRYGPRRPSLPSPGSEGPLGS